MCLTFNCVISPTPQLLREKATLDEKLAEALSTVTEEEEKSKGLMKLKARHESSIGELEDKLHKEEKVSVKATHCSDPMKTPLSN